MILLFGNLGNERDVRIKEKEAVVWPKKLLTRLDMVMHLFKNGPSLASFLFIFVPIKYKLYRKIVEFSGIRTRIVEVEGEHSDHHHGTYL